MFDQEKLLDHFRKLMIETCTAHNRTFVAYEKMPFRFRARMTRWQNCLTYATWNRDFRPALEISIANKVEQLVLKATGSGMSKELPFEQISDAEFALRAQLTFTLFRATTDCLGCIPSVNENGFWTVSDPLNGFVFRIFDKNKPFEFEFGRYVAGKGDGRFLEFTSAKGWRINRYELSHTYSPPVESRKARLSEVYFDPALNQIADELIADKLGEQFFHYHLNWCGSWAPPYA
jgi:hypothetical protein